ncbi:hypothetical protein QBC35DRAFT_69147 [Podospora australis]|uniref:SprT-like domain-containing protein n=1 Tax=Podospora australis TaxID=1536484 RepID=A0AAN6WMI8_9PEZI|nr:hypothetical protein QBC35DRAFT_69147 [Podospora australis]
MARPVEGGDYPPAPFAAGPFHPAKRHADDDDLNPPYKRPKNIFATVAYKTTMDVSPFEGIYSDNRHRYLPDFQHPPPFLTACPPSSLSTPQTQRPASAPPIERTASGLSIQSDPTEFGGSTKLLEDHEAAQRVREHLVTFRRRNPDSKHERILRSIINPRQREEPLDHEHLLSIFSAANEIFFNGRLSQRVMWDWSHESSTQYDCRVIGTTALRRANPKARGFETLIVLSSTILRDKRYSRRLLISTFLHELIHSYMFICCGFRARCDGGHTPGFREIAQIVDDWAGKEAALYLSRVEADLELFRTGGTTTFHAQKEEHECCERYTIRGGRSRVAVTPSIYPCSGMAEQREYSRDYMEDALTSAAAAAAAAAAGLGAYQEPVAMKVFTAGFSPDLVTTRQELSGYYYHPEQRHTGTSSAGKGSEYSSNIHPWPRQPQRAAHRPGPVYMSSYSSDYAYVYPGNTFYQKQ